MNNNIDINNNIIKIDLEGSKGSLIVNRKRNNNSPRTRTILARKTMVGMSDEQLLRIRKTMSRLIELAPVTRTPEMKKAKAFMIWSEKLPLIQKCNELVLQLQERSSLLATIRDSYLRDVVSIRVHLENFYQKNGMDSSLKELNSIPSVDLRPLMETAYNDNNNEKLSSSSSFSLKDSLMKAHLVSPEVQENWMKNPWERSKSYALYREKKDQMKLSLPQGGNSINLYAPSRHRLYIKYCKQCIGIMTFVTDWNNDIEKLIKKRIESKTNEELRQIIRNLNDYIIDKTEECEKLQQELFTIKSGKKYIQVWQDTEKSAYEKTDITSKMKKFRELYHQWNEEALMSNEDNLQLRIKLNKLTDSSQSTTIKYEEKIKKLINSYEEKIELKEDQIYQLGNQIHEKELVIEQKEMKIETHVMQLNEQLKETERYIRVNQQLIVSIDEKDKIISDYRLEAMNMIESLETQVSKLTEDIFLLEKENERYRKEKEEQEEQLLQKRKNEKNNDNKSSNLTNRTTIIRPGEQMYEENSEDQPSNNNNNNNNHLAQFLRMKAVIGVLPRHLRKVLAHNITKYAPLPIDTQSESFIQLDEDNEEQENIDGEYEEGVEYEEEVEDDENGIEEDGMEEEEKSNNNKLKSEDINDESKGNDNDDIVSLESFGSKHSNDENKNKSKNNTKKVSNNNNNNNNSTIESPKQVKTKKIKVKTNSNSNLTTTSTSTSKIQNDNINPPISSPKQQKFSPKLINDKKYINTKSMSQSERKSPLLSPSFSQQQQQIGSPKLNSTKKQSSLNSLSGIVSNTNTTTNTTNTTTNTTKGRKTVMADIGGVVVAAEKMRRLSTSKKRSTMVLNKPSSISSRNSFLRSPSPSNISHIASKDLSDKNVLTEILIGDDDDEDNDGDNEKDGNNEKSNSILASNIKTKLVTRHTLRARLSIAKKLSSIEMPVSPSIPIITTTGHIQEEENLDIIEEHLRSNSTISQEQQQIQIYNNELIRANSSIIHSSDQNDQFIINEGSINGGNGGLFPGTSLHQQSSFHNLSSSYHEGVSNLLELLVPYIKPPTSLKIVAIAIRFTIRFNNGIKSKDYDLLGSWGQKILLKKYIKKNEELNVDNNKILKENERLNLKYDRQVTICDSYLNKINILEKDKQKLNVQINELKFDINRYNLMLKRYKIISQSERSMAYEMMKYITFLRERIYVLANTMDTSISTKLNNSLQLQSQSLSNNLNNNNSNNNNNNSNDILKQNQIQQSQSLTLINRKVELKKKLIRFVTNFLEVIRDYKKQYPLKIFSLNPNFCINFKSYGSKLRNEHREIRQYFKFTLFDLNNLEKKYDYKQNKIIELTDKLNDMVNSLQCPTCIEYKGLYLEQQRLKQQKQLQKQKQLEESNLLIIDKKESNDNFDNGIPIYRNNSNNVLLEFDWDSAESTNNPTIKRLKEHLKKEILEEVTNKFESEFQLLLEKYIRREEELRNKINQLELDKIKLQNEDNTSTEILLKHRNQLIEKDNQINYLMKQNAVLKVAIEDSYRVCQYEQEQIEYKENQLKELLDEIEKNKQNKSEIGTQLEINQKSLIEMNDDDLLHQLDKSLQLKAKNFLKRLTGIESTLPVTTTTTTTSSSTSIIDFNHNLNKTQQSSFLSRQSINNPKKSTFIQTSPSFISNSKQNPLTSTSTSMLIKNQNNNNNNNNNNNEIIDSNSSQNILKRSSKFESIRNIPISSSSTTTTTSTTPNITTRASTMTTILPSMMVHMNISEEDSEALESFEEFNHSSSEKIKSKSHSIDNDNNNNNNDNNNENNNVEEENEDDKSRVEDVIYKPIYHMDLKKTSQMAAHLQSSLMGTNSAPSLSTSTITRKISTSTSTLQSKLPSQLLTRPLSASGLTKQQNQNSIRPYSGNDMTRTIKSNSSYVNNTRQTLSASKR